MSGSLCIDTRTFRENVNTKLCQPLPQGCYSLNKRDRSFIPNLAGVKYLRTVSERDDVHFDLNLGFRPDVVNNEFTPDLNPLLKWIQRERDNPLIMHNNMMFVCYRGLLAKIMITLYETQENWCICATRIRNIIYLKLFETDEMKLKKENQTARDKQFMFWGYKFEQYMLSDIPNEPPDLVKEELNQDEFCVVYRTRINNKCILYAAEVDGVDQDTLITENINQWRNKIKFIELKTSLEITNEKIDWSFKRYKLLKWWSQSVLVDINEIICGFRDKNGIVKRIKKFRTHQLPSLAEGAWEPVMCLNFLDKFLDGVIHKLSNYPDQTLFKFNWSPGKPIMFNILDKPSEYDFIPQWFVDYMDVSFQTADR